MTLQTSSIWHPPEGFVLTTFSYLRKFRHCQCVFVGDYKNSSGQTLLDTMKIRETWLEKGVPYLTWTWMAEFAGKSHELGFEALLCEFCGLFLLTEKNPQICEISRKWS